MYTCPVLFGLSWMTKIQTDCAGKHKQPTYDSYARMRDLIRLRYATAAVYCKNHMMD